MKQRKQYSKYIMTRPDREFETDYNLLEDMEYCSNLNNLQMESQSRNIDGWYEDVESSGSGTRRAIESYDRWFPLRGYYER